jgi:hypothetical protein
VDADDGFQRGGFSHAIAAHETEHVVGLDVEGDAAQDAGAAEGDAEIVNLQHGRLSLSFRDRLE